MGRESLVRVFAAALTLLVGLAGGEAGAGTLTVWPSPRAVVADAEGWLRFDLVVVNHGDEPARDLLLRDQAAAGAQWGAGGGADWAVALGDLAPGAHLRVPVALRGGADLGARLDATVAGIPHHALAAAVEPLSAARWADLGPYLSPSAGAVTGGRGESSPARAS